MKKNSTQVTSTTLHVRKSYLLAQKIIPDSSIWFGVLDYFREIYIHANSASKMHSLENQLLETWRIHNETMRLLITHIPEAAFGATMSTRGGRDISRQLAHVHNVRMMHLENFLKQQPDAPKPFAKDESPTQEALLTAFESSSAAMTAYLTARLEKERTTPNPKGGVPQLLGYFIAHEAQHRGSILLTMKLKGYPIPDILKWGIWDWGKL
jgi:uncharacterized damage-inducible protein DinB